MSFGDVIRSVSAAVGDVGGDGSVIWCGRTTTISERSVSDLSYVRGTTVATNVTGCGGKADVIWAGNITTNKVYEYSVVDLSEVRSAADPAGGNQGCGGDSDHIWYYDVGIAKVYELSPVDFSVVQGPTTQPYTGLARIGGDTNRVWWCDNFPDRVAELNGSGFTAIRTVSSPGSVPAGVGGDYEHLYHYDAVSGLLYELDPGLIAGTVETYPAQDIRHDQAEGHGGVTNVGDTAVLEIGFDYGLTAAYGSEVTEEVDADADFSGEFTLVMTGLSAVTEYHFRAKARDSTGWFYGADDTFMSDTPRPRARTLIPTDVGDYEATLNGKIVDVGGDATCDKRGFVYGQSSVADPIAHDTAPADSGYDEYSEEEGSFGIATFDLALEKLKTRTIYYFRAWAHNSYGYHYGKQIAFLVCKDINWLLASSIYNVGTGIRFDSSGHPNHPYAGTVDHDILLASEDAEFTAGTFGYYTGHYIYENNWYDSNMHTDLFNLHNPTNRETGVVKIKWKAKTFRNSYPYGKYQRVLKTHDTEYEGDEANCAPNGWKCEVFGSNPNTETDWTIDELDDLMAGIALGKGGGWGRPMCDCFRIEVFWVEAAVQTRAAQAQDATTLRLFGLVLEDEIETCEVYFEYGETESFGSETTPEEKAKDEEFYADVTVSGAIYYRAVIETACGETFYGETLRSAGGDASAAITRVTGIRHIYRPGSFRLEANLGGITNTGDVVKHAVILPPAPSATKEEAAATEPARTVELPEKTAQELAKALEDEGLSGPIITGPLMPGIVTGVTKDWFSEYLDKLKARKQAEENARQYMQMAGIYTPPKPSLWQRITPWKEEEGETFGSELAERWRSVTGWFGGLFK